MNNYIYVFIGGGLGSLARYGIFRLTVHLMQWQWPLASILSNSTSSFLVGLLLGITIDKSPLGMSTRLFLITGFCGGFSTFSAFSFETFEFIRNGQAGNAVLHIGVNVISCLLLIWAGLTLARQFLNL